MQTLYHNNTSNYNCWKYIFFNVCHPEVLYIEYTNVSVYNTTIYFLYIKVVYYQGNMFQTSLGHLQALEENRSKIT